MVQATSFELLDDTGGVGNTLASLASLALLPNPNIGNPNGKLELVAEAGCCCCLSRLRLELSNPCLEGSGGAPPIPSGTLDGNGGVGTSIFA